MRKRKTLPQLAKLTAPRLPKVVERLHLYRQLDQMLKLRPIVWIVGAPGMGKTTLVNSYLRARKNKPLWYQFDAGDQDPATFFHYLRLGFQAYAPRSRLSLPQLTAEYFGGLQIFVRRFFEQLLSNRLAPRILVFDNYQDFPENSVVQQLLPIGMEILPPGVSVIVMSREQPSEAWVKLRANQHMNLIEEESLRFTEKEEEVLLSMHLGEQQQARFGQQRAVLKMAEGWVAGLILLIEQLKTLGELEPIEPQAGKHVIFEYLAREVFEHIPQEEQAILAKSSIFPWMTGQMMAELTEIPDIQSLLERLAHHRYFTVKNPGRNPAYRYHPLFHVFLRSQFERLFPPEQQRNIMKKAGTILEKYGESDEVVNVYHQIGDVQEIIRFILEHAPILLAQGRQETLRRWLTYVPRETFDQNPWLWFWQASAVFLSSPIQSQTFYKNALQGFQASGEGLGQVVSVLGYVESLWFSWGDLHLLDDWLPRLEALLVQFPGPYPLDIQTRILAVRLTWAYRYHLISDQLDTWAWQLVDLLERIPAISQRVMLMLPAIGWLFWRKPKKELEAITHQVRSWAEQDSPPIVSASVLFTEALLAIHIGDMNNGIQAIQSCIKLAEKEGMFFLRRQAIAIRGWLTLLRGDQSLAKENFECWGEFAVDHQGVMGFMYHGLATWWALDHKQWDKISHHLSQTDQRSDCGAAYQKANWLLMRAHVQFEMGHLQQAHKDLEYGAMLARRYGIIQTEHMADFARAYFAFQEGQEGTAREALQAGLSLVQKTGICTNFVWRRSVMTFLCIKALEHDIEVGQAQEIIKKYDYRPSNPPYTLSNWPWAVKVTTLGPFAIEVDSQPVTFGRKVPRRVLALLQAIIAFGGQQVKEDQLMDALWPESDGDRAYRSYATALHRLRKLLGDESVVIVQDRKVSLDPYRCWVDVWAFEHLLDQAVMAKTEKEIQKSANLCEQALKLYQGLFLNDNENAPWAARTRERLRKKYVTHVESLCRAWKDDGKVEEVRALFEQALNHEPEGLHDDMNLSRQ